MSRRLPWIAALLLAGAVATRGEAGFVLMSGCGVNMPDQWVMRGDRGTGPGGASVRLLRLASAQLVVAMARNSGFQTVEQTPERILFMRRLPNGVLHFRAVTRRTPACVADVVAPAPAAAAARAIAMSIR